MDIHFDNKDTAETVRKKISSLKEDEFILFSFNIYVISYIEPKAKVIHEHTSASYYDCVKAAIHLLEPDKLECFEKLCLYTLKTTSDRWVASACVFIDVLNDHKNGVKEKISRGELEVYRALNKHKVKFIREKQLSETCKLRYDFFIPDKNIAIEFDGKQHFESVQFFGGDAALISNQERDKRKDEFSAANGVKLLRIRYDQDNIESLVIGFVNGVLA